VSDTDARRRPLIITVVAIVIALIVAAALWLAFGPQLGASPAANPSETTVPATPSVYPTPTPGSTNAAPTVAPTQAPIADPVTVGGLTARVASMERFTLKDSSIPGEVDGPAVRVTVEVTNTGKTAVDITGAQLSAAFGATAEPGPELSGNGTKAFPATVQPGETVKAVGAYSIPDGAGDSVHLELDLLAGKPAIVFVGQIPRT
jgi:hypothetical protein